MTGRAVRRAVWLAELALALEQAGRVCRTLASATADEEAPTEVEAQITALRLEIEALCGARPTLDGKYPKRT